MNLISGEIVEIFIKEGTTMATVSVEGAVMRVPIIFLSEAKVGDRILIESGVAISKVEQEYLKDT